MFLSARIPAHLQTETPILHFIMINSSLWIRSEQSSSAHICVYRNVFELSAPASLSLEYSADERAQVFLDGEWLADGPLRGTKVRWFAEKVQTPVLAAGKHTLVLVNYCFGYEKTAYGQLTIRQGVYVGGADADKLNPTWEYQRLDGCHFISGPNDWGSYAHILTDEDFNWDFRFGRGGDWTEATKEEDTRPLEVTCLPPRERGECTDYKVMGDLFVFNDYELIRGEYVFEGTGEVRLRWVEGAPLPGQSVEEFKKRRKPTPGYAVSEFYGTGDRFILNGQRVKWTDYWWHAGRSLQVSLFGDVKLVSAKFHSTGYPWKLEQSLEVPGDPDMTRLLKKSWRTLEMCTCDTMMDCPYYEQLQYISDSRLQMLSLYTVTSDTRLLEKAMEQFTEGQSANGALPDRFPGKDTDFHEPVVGEQALFRIPSFMCFYISMVHDYALTHDNPEFVRGRLPFVRKVSRYLASCLVPEIGGVLEVPGWNFIDWNRNWHDGMPPHCERGNGCTLNFIFLQALKDLLDLEIHYGTPEEAAWCRQQVEALSVNIPKAFYVPEKGIYAESPDKVYFSEHAQIWAILALNDLSVLPALRKGDLEQTGIAFSFYYFAATRAAKADDLFQARMQRYIDTAKCPELVTMPECFPNNWWMRSDCHAWSSHAIFWHFAKFSILDRIR